MFDLNKQYNVDMCSSVVRGGKVFTTDQKLRELKKRIFRLKALKNKIKSKRLTPYEIMKKPVENMISMPSVKYQQVLSEVEKNAIASEANRGRFNFARLEKIKTEKNRLEKFDEKFKREKN